MFETSVEQCEQLAHLALSHGGERRGPRIVHWDIGGNCHQPIAITKWSRSTHEMSRLSKGGVKHRPMMQVTLETKCRKCPQCLRERSSLWRFRAIEETKAAERTWFATLTLRPEAHYKVDLMAATKVANYEGLPPEDKFRHSNKIIGQELTKYLKRVRENAGARFRYLAVTEIHNSRNTSPEMRGRPHLHLLMHEFQGQPLRKAVLEQAWSHGYTSFKLAEGTKGAMYLCKYISKAIDARVRASIDYGNNARYA